MLDAVRDEFEKRSDEIDLLFSHVEALSSCVDPAGRGEDGLLPILLSSLCLMLYNQIESTAFSCVEAIYDAVHERAVNFNALVEGFKRKILDDCKESYHSGSSLLRSIQGRDIACVLAKASLKIDRVFSGNVDAKKIRDILKLYNLIVTNPTPDNAGADLVSIKDARNALAHGASSFEKHGRNLTLSDLDRFRNNVREYMGHIVVLTEAYLVDERYLDRVSAA